MRSKRVLAILGIVTIVSMLLAGVVVLAQEPVPPNEAPLEVYTWDYPEDFGGVTVNLVGDAGHNLKPYEFWKEDFAKVGININVIEIPFAEVYEKEKTEFVAGTGAFDVVTYYPVFTGEFAGLGYLEPLDDYMAKDPPEVWDPKADDVLAPYWELYCKFGGKTYAMPVDGDIIMLEYRRDLFENEEEQAAFQEKYGRELTVPETWDEYLEVAEFFTRKAGETLAGEALAEDFYGLAEYGQRDWGFAWYLNRFASWGGGGMYFDEDMNPTINTPEAVAALEHMVESFKYGPPDMLAYGYEELKDAFLQGYTAMVIQWPCVPKKSNNPEESKIVGKVGVASVPGYKIEDGSVVHRSMMPCGRVVAVAADSPNKEAAYWVAKHISYDRSLDDVSTMLTGLDPYRKSHFEHPEAYTMFANVEDAEIYLKGVEANMANGFPEIFIPGGQQYEESLSLHANMVLAGEESAQDALDAVANEWNEITDKLGRETQVELWRAALESFRGLGLIE